MSSRSSVDRAPNPVYGRSWVRFLSGSQICLSHARDILISSPFSHLSFLVFGCADETLSLVFHIIYQTPETVFHRDIQTMRRENERCKCSHDITGKMTWKNSGFERHSNPRPLHYRCNALPTELSKPHESGQVSWCVTLRDQEIEGFCYLKELIDSKKSVNSQFLFEHEPWLLQPLKQTFFILQSLLLSLFLFSGVVILVITCFQMTMSQIFAAVIGRHAILSKSFRPKYWL